MLKRSGIATKFCNIIKLERTVPGNFHTENVSVKVFGYVQHISRCTSKAVSVTLIHDTNRVIH